MAEDVYTLVASANDGRFALDFAQGQDLTSGTRIAIDLDGRWIPGRVEHVPDLYPNEDVQYLKNERLPRTTGGYSDQPTYPALLPWDGRASFCAW